MRSISFLIQGAESALLSAFASPQRTPQAGAQTANQSVTGAFSNLNLTAQEQTAIHSLVQSASTGSLSFAQLTSKIDGVLSPEQQQTFKTDLQALAAAQHHHAYRGSGARSASNLGDLAAQIDIQSQLRTST